MQIVIHEQRAIGQKKGRSRQHVVDRLQEFRKLSAQIPSVAGPFPDASSSELPFLVANQHRPFDEGTCQNHIRIIYFELHHLQLVLDIAGENQLEPIEVFGKEAKPITPIYKMRHLLSEIRDVANPALPIDQAGHRMALALRRVDDRRPIMVGDVVKTKRNTMACQDVFDGDAEGGPRKLDESEHGAYMTEAK